MILQEAYHVRQADTPSALWRRDLAPMGLRLFASLLHDPEGRIAAARPQDETVVTYEPPMLRPATAAIPRLPP